ncbi:hypothetical protein CFP65_2862 [Kitasatospora sp. MMS16-BH015]|uniref:DUF2752 domain-containing protein n=1 Tax=Kitasatospora sp. MMS16-BH015 TaxID=2018025 RepID=UPI000CA3A613|nr:DUF2752 domain-containing protein [Kitasatospora sp. MMS16-BH015]AUG77678.1 hypothetical protein CFP65_2862 [Kitasatospora sp. MMS16-BH015]
MALAAARLPVRSALARVLARLGVGAAAAFAVARLHDAHDPGVLCPLRLLTGVPCPFCGSTTVFIEAGHGRAPAALAANPVTVLALLVLALFPVLPARLRRVPPLPLVGAALALSWVWQLHRLGVVLS